MRKINVYKIFSAVLLLSVLFTGRVYAETINSPDKTVTLTMTLVIQAPATVTQDPTAAAGLKYDGSPHDLLATAGTAADGTMVYALGSADTAPSSYNKAIPTGTNAGTYHVWYMASGDATHRNSAAVSLDVTISKADSTITTAPTAKNGLTYNAAAQALITSGDAQGGTFYYVSGDNATTAPTSGYTADIPTATDEGTYYIWYKVSGDINHNDTDAKCLTVKITLESYTISYTLNGGTASPDNPTSYTMKSPDIVLTAPSRNGYKFSGWTGSNGTTPQTSVTIPNGTSGDKNYTANWNIITYSISFTLGGGTLDSNITSYDVETPRTIPQPTRGGYDFDGWLLSGDTDDTLSTDLTIPKGTTGDLEYVAKWTAHIYTISYDLHGGAASPDNPAHYTIESTDILLTSPDKAAYTFMGWMLSGDSDWELSADVTIPSGSSGDREYIAQWQVITYAISYDLQGGAVSLDNPVSYDVESADITLSNPTKTGYDFKGWSGTGLSEAAINVTIPEGSSGDRSYTAAWGPITYAITYDLKGGRAASANPVSYDIESAAIKLTNPTRTGYTFTGWSGTDITGRSMEVTIPSGSIGERKYTANWAAVTYSISYNLNGGSARGNPDTYTIETEDTTLINPTKSGCNFDGWTGTGLSSRTARVIIPRGSTGNREYTAHFSIITYPIDYDLDDGTNAPENPAGHTVEDDTIILQTPTREGYDFIGWMSGDKTVTEIPAGSIGSMELIAVWRETAPVILQDTYTLNATKGKYTSLDINASGVNLSWDIDGTLPEGLAFSAQGNTAVISGIPTAETSTPQEVTITAANEGGTASARIIITVNETLSMDIAITTERDDFTAHVGEEFSTTINIDVTLKLADQDYNGYAYSLDIAGLPEWLNAEGELESSDTLETGGAKRHHEVKLSGTPTASHDAQTITLTAKVNVSGLEAYGMKKFTIKTEAGEAESVDVTLQSLDVVINGGAELSAESGASEAMTLTAQITGTYSDGSTGILSPETYTLTWEADADIEGVSFSGGTLSVSESALPGSWDVTITAAASSGSITASATKTVRVIVEAAESVVPVLTCRTPSVTLSRGSTLESLIVTSDAVSDEWTHDGELPDGLSFTTNSSTFIISGTVSLSAETGEYVFNVRAVNEAGASEPVALRITITSGASLRPESESEISVEDLTQMTDDELQETLGHSTNIQLTGDVENISALIERIESVAEIKTLDLSEVTGVEDLTLEDTKIESINLTGNTSIKNVEVTNAPALAALNLAGSSVENVELSGTSIAELNLTDCVSLEVLYCSSCDVERLIIDGCDNLVNINCSYNQLVMFDASGLANLHSLECSHQHAVKPLQQTMNFGSFMRVSGTLRDSNADDEEASCFRNVKNLKAYDESGNLLAVNYDEETGAAVFSSIPARITYDYDTGFNNVLMDVEITNSESISYNNVPGGSGGCESGIGLCALAALSVLLKRK